MWWQDVIIAAIMILGVYGFVVLVRFQTRTLTRKGDRTAEDLYDNYADPGRLRPVWQAGNRDDGGHVKHVSRMLTIAGTLTRTH